MSNIAEELQNKAIEMGIEGPYTSWWHMFGWNTFGLLLLGPAVATQRFFDTLNKIESRLNEWSPDLVISRGVKLGNSLDKSRCRNGRR